MTGLLQGGFWVCPHTLPCVLNAPCPITQHPGLKSISQWCFHSYSISDDFFYLTLSQMFLFKFLRHKRDNWWHKKIGGG